MPNSNLEALPSQIRAKSLAYAVAAAQNGPQKPRTRDISFWRLLARVSWEKKCPQYKYKGVHSLLHISSNQVRWFS